MFQVNFDNFEVGTYKDLAEAKEAILVNHYSSVGVDRIVELDEEGEETDKEYGCSWELTLEEI